MYLLIDKQGNIVKRFTHITAKELKDLLEQEINKIYVRTNTNKRELFFRAGFRNMQSPLRTDKSPYFRLTHYRELKLGDFYN